ncbi:MAG: hypothetical protein KKD11_06895, partial [Candidatus Omnitrophica bacterium]|nr:hypothetical protein [Candidatus Omnitrophota bacterium]
TSGDIRDKLNKPLIMISFLTEDLELEHIEKEVFVALKDINESHLDLLKHIKSPTESVLKLAAEASEEEGQPERTYKFLALYFKAVVQEQSLYMKTEEMFSEATKAIDSIMDIVKPERSEEPVVKDAARIFESLLKNEIKKMENLKQEDILKNTEVIQTAIRKIEDALIFALDEENENKIKDLVIESKEEIHIIFVKNELMTGKTNILKDLRIIKTILAEITPDSIEAYISTARSFKANQSDL